MPWTWPVAAASTVFFLLVSIPIAIIAGWMIHILNISSKRVPGKPNTLIGTDGYFKNLADLTPGFNKGDKTNLQPGAKAYKGPSGRDFINKYRKK